MILSTKYHWGQILFLKTDKEQNPRMLIGVTFRVSGVLYELGFGGTASWHFEMEITDSKDVLTATS